MQSSKIIIATIVIILAANVLTGCGTAKIGKVSETEAIARITDFKEVTKSLELRLEQEVQGSRVVLRAFLDNPDSKPVSSAQVWLSYNPDHMQGIEVKTAESAFQIPAPYKNSFDENQGLVQLGGATNSPSTSAVIHVGEIVFNLKNKGATMVDAYDYRDDLTGHVSANVLFKGAPYNILRKPTSPLIVINQ